MNAKNMTLMRKVSGKDSLPETFLINSLLKNG